MASGTLLCYLHFFNKWAEIYIDDHHRNPNINDRDHLVGQLTVDICSLLLSTQTPNKLAKHKWWDHWVGNKLETFEDALWKLQKFNTQKWRGLYIAQLHALYFSWSLQCTVSASEAKRSRCHKQTQGHTVNHSTIAVGPKIQCVVYQQVKNLNEKKQMCTL